MIGGGRLRFKNIKELKNTKSTLNNKTCTRKLVFIIDKRGRALTKKSSHRLISELFDKALCAKGADAIVLSGKSFNDCRHLDTRISGKSVADWELIYFHGREHPPVLLTNKDKKKLVALLPSFQGTSAEATYKVLNDAGVYRHCRANQCHGKGCA